MKINRVLTSLLVLSCTTLLNPARAYICDNAQFFEQCPTGDPIFATIVQDFKIRRDGVLIDPTTLICNPPISTIPIAAYTDEIILLQALRAIYYMDLGRSNHLPWTAKTLYGWLKENLGGFEITTSVGAYDQWLGQAYAGSGDTSNYFQIRAKLDAQRDFQRKWEGLALAISLMMHERRHGDGIGHVRCCTAQNPDPTKPDACDPTYDESASISPYGIQYWLEKNWVSGHIAIGLGCMAPIDQASAISLMWSDANGHVSPTSNFCSGTPPVLTNTTNPPESCTACSGISGSSSGDPHISTLDGLYYDFQAAGDFLLTTNGPNFIVQVRQKWTPNRPNVAINKAVAMKMGKTRVAVFLDPFRLVVDGNRVALADGKSLWTQDNVEISRKANIYVIKSGTSETVRVEAVDSIWVSILGGHFLDVSVSLNNPTNGRLRGLLGNGNGNVRDDIANREGKAFAQPISFNDLYHRYAKSLYIGPKESLFGERRHASTDKLQGGNIKNAFKAPSKPYTVKNLGSKEYKSARATCIEADVTTDVLLDACTLDIAVLKSPKVAKRYSGVTAPVAVMEPGKGINLLSGGMRKE